MNSGIPYFPLDVHLDDKFELIEAEFGLYLRKHKGIMFRSISF